MRLAIAVALSLTCALAATAQDAPVLTEVERLKLELLQTRAAFAQLQANFDTCKAEVGATYQSLGQVRAALATKTLTDEEAALTAAVEAAHPGWAWNPKTGLFSRKESR